MSDSNRTLAGVVGFRPDYKNIWFHRAIRDSVNAKILTKIDPVLLNRPQRILLVDDEPTVLSLVATVLGREGYQVIHAVNPIEALRLAALPDGAPDLLLTDVIMPGLTGPLLARAIQRASPGTRILFMTGHAPAGDGNTGIPWDADVLRKPFRVGELVERVRLALEPRTIAAAC